MKRSLEHIDDRIPKRHRHVETLDIEDRKDECLRKFIVVEYEFEAQRAEIKRMNDELKQVKEDSDAKINMLQQTFDNVYRACMVIFDSPAFRNSQIAHTVYHNFN